MKRDYRFIKNQNQLMLDFNGFHSTKITITSIENICMI
ncbi:hypothetical protein OCHUTO_0252 [Orientia chuto str. Dubai]|uniref:Uncharacterized protein n=1 Tax=Orientia chuto str. Dubai TaxID=1359168 RepID=A0A0F3MMX6_9RICK|nr:hypothetical protein OCHUTO_0252 [Orientia chuto str. Dubai]